MAITIRNLSPGEIMARARSDRRTLAYNLLPLTGGPARRAWLARLVTPFYPHTASFQPSDKAQTLYRQVAERGYSEAFQLIDAAALAALQEWFRERPCRDRYRPHLGRFRPDAVPSPETNLGYYEAPEILAAPGALELFNHPVLLELAELYLGCRPTLDNIQCWWSFCGRPEPKGTQWYHRDWDNLRSVRFFLYLTDVDSRSGAHQFVSGSHLSEAMVEINRIPDDRVQATFGSDSVATLEGAAGTCLVADTFGVHRGLLPLDRPRLMMTAQYGIWRTPHAPPRPVLRRPSERYDPYINRVYLYDVT